MLQRLSGIHPLTLEEISSQNSTVCSQGSIGDLSTAAALR